MNLAKGKLFHKLVYKRYKQCNSEMQRKLGPECILGKSTNNVYTNVTADCGNPFQL